VNAAQLQAWFTANQKPILGVAAAGAVGFGVLRARKRTAAAAGGAGVPGASTAGSAFASGPAIAGTTTPYDSSVMDVYNGLQDQIDGITTKMTAPLPVPSAPVASTLFAPSGTGNYVRLQNGVVGEVESDGSIFGLGWNQWKPLMDAGATWTELQSNPNWYSTEKNTNTAAAAAAAKLPS
jgi:hypothetical protein